MALGLTASAAYTAPSFGRLVSSARSFHYYFHEVKKSGSSLSPVERFVFSLVLANTKSHQAQVTCAPPDRRT